MSATPLARIERLLRVVRRGWEATERAHEVRDAAARWLAEHPSGRPELDALWSAALDGRGPLALWLAAGADPDAWAGPASLREILTTHPFVVVDRWSSPAT